MARSGARPQLQASGALSVLSAEFVHACAGQASIHCGGRHQGVARANSKRFLCPSLHQVLSSGRSGPRSRGRPRLTPRDHEYTGARRCRDGLGSGPVPGLPVPRVVLWVAVLVSIAATCSAASVFALESRCEQLHKARLPAPSPTAHRIGSHAESLSASLHWAVSMSVVIQCALLEMAVGSCPGPTLVNASDVSSVTVMRSNVKYQINMEW